MSLTLDLQVVSRMASDIIVLEIGSNDLCDSLVDPMRLASDMCDFIKRLHDEYRVQHIIVSQVIRRVRPFHMFHSYNAIGSSVK